jgi:transcriptional regulator with XRE-family HTH domain
MVKTAKDAEEDPQLQALYLAIGQKIKAVRLERKFSQKDLAIRTDIKQQYLAEIELFGVNLSLRLLKRIATALDLTLRDLLPGSEEAEDCDTSLRSLRAEMAETLSLFEAQYTRMLALVDRADQLGKKSGHVTTSMPADGKVPRPPIT